MDVVNEQFILAFTKKLNANPHAKFHVSMIFGLGVRAEIDDQVFSARTLAEALMQLHFVCKWPSKNTVQRLQKRCRRISCDV